MNTHTYERHRHEDPEFPIIFHINERRGSAPDPYMHWHESLELLYFVEGQGTVTADGISVRAGDGDLVVINSNHLHQIQADTQMCRYYCLIVDKAFCDDFHLPVGELQFSMMASDERTRGYFDLIIREMLSRQSYYKQQVKAASLELMVHLARFYAQQRSSVAGGGGKRMEMIKEAVQYIQLNYKEALPIDEIAAHAGFSKYYFCRAFRDVTGYSVVEYINFLRCQNARKLLKSGAYNVGQSAAMSGFQNLSYFARVYRRQFGNLPSEEL